MIFSPSNGQLPNLLFNIRIILVKSTNAKFKLQIQKFFNLDYELILERKTWFKFCLLLILYHSLGVDKQELKKRA